MGTLISMLVGAIFLGFCIACISAIKQYIDNSIKESSKDITGHTPAIFDAPIVKKKDSSEKSKGYSNPLNMATPKLELAFAEQPDWSEYDQPTYLRKKQELRVFEEVTKEVQAEVVSVKRQPSSKKTRMTPQEQLAEFKQNSKGRFTNGNYEKL